MENEESDFKFNPFKDKDVKMPTITVQAGSETRIFGHKEMKDICRCLFKYFSSDLPKLAGDDFHQSEAALFELLKRIAPMSPHGQLNVNTHLMFNDYSDKE